MPSGGHNKGNGKTFAWLLAHVNHQGEECLIWPFSKTNTGYGNLGYMGKMMYAHRFMCELANGLPPTSDHEAAHNCGNGMGSCVHPKHLEWKTASENHLDRRCHGTAVTNRFGPTGKLTKAQRQEIIALKGKMTQVEIAEKYGVCFQTISRWHRSDPNQKRSSFPFDAEDDIKLKAAVAQGLSNQAIAELMGRKKISIIARKCRLKRQERIQLEVLP